MPSKLIRFSVVGKTGQFLLLSRQLDGEKALDYRDFLLPEPAIAGVNDRYKNHPDKSLRDPVKVLCDKEGMGSAAITESVYLQMLQQMRCLLPMEAGCEVGCYEGLLKEELEYR